MVNFKVATTGIETAGQALVKKLAPSYGRVMGTVGTADIKGLKFADFAKAVEGIDGVKIKELQNGGKIVKLQNCCKLQQADLPKNVVVKFNKEGDCLMLSGAGHSKECTQGFSLRTQEGIDSLLAAGCKNPGERVSTVIHHPYTYNGVKSPGEKWMAENSGTPTQDIIHQAYEYPYLGGNALKKIET